MTIEIIAIPGSVFIATTLVAKLYELRGDVLYGPYIDGRKRSFADARDQFAQALEASGVRQGLGRFAFRLGSVSYLAAGIIG